MPAARADTLNTLTSRIIESAIDIHRILGPGLLERAYLICLTRELVDADLRIQTQHAILLRFKNVNVERAYIADLVVEESVLVEVKAMEALAPIHDRQLDTYLRLGDYRVGLLLNFGAETMKAGIRRRVNRFPDK